MTVRSKAAASVAVVAVGMFIASMTGRETMALFGTNVLFSELEGQILLNGEAVEGAEVTQITLWSHEGAVEPVTTRTDADGRFRFSEISRRAGFSNLLPGQITIVQKINIVHGGKEYRGWLNTKSNYDRNGELNGKPLRLECELSHEPTDEGDDFGVCRVV